MRTRRRFSHFLGRIVAFRYFDLEQLHSPVSRVSDIQAITRINPQPGWTDEFTRGMPWPSEPREKLSIVTKNANHRTVE